jgi:hypothetical protein
MQYVTPPQLTLTETENTACMEFTPEASKYNVLLSVVFTLQSPMAVFKGSCTTESDGPMQFCTPERMSKRTGWYIQL